MLVLESLINKRISTVKAIVAFAVMFAVSFCFSGLMLVDYPNHIENKRHQIAKFSNLLKHDLGQDIESEIIICGEHCCRQEWDDIKNDLSDFVELVSATCGLLLLLFSSERILISNKHPHICVDYRWLKGNKHTGWIVFSGMMFFCGMVYTVMTILSRCMLTFLMWSRMADVIGVDASTRCRQLLSSWDQLLVCDKWINGGYCLWGLCLSLVVIIWILANVHFVRKS